MILERTEESILEGTGKKHRMILEGRILRGTGKDLRINCRNILGKKLEGSFREMREEVLRNWKVSWMKLGMGYWKELLQRHWKE